MKLYSIGIDPGSRTGIGVWCGMDETMVSVVTVDYGKAMSEIMGLVQKYGPRLAAIGVEVPRSKFTYQRKKQRTYAMRKIAHNVGDCFRKAKSLAEFCRVVTGSGVKVYELNPARTKLSRQAFQDMTGYPTTENSSEHSRDAGMIAIRAYASWKREKMIEEADEQEN